MMPRLFRASKSIKPMLIKAADCVKFMLSNNQILPLHIIDLVVEPINQYHAAYTYIRPK